MHSHKHVEQLMLFGKLAETLSFTQAADHLGISKGYLSRQIKDLETRMAASLLIRSTRHVRLTDDGQRVLKHVEQIQGNLLSLERELRHKDDISGLLRITTPPLFGAMHLGKICSAFRQQYPNVRFEINVSNTVENLIDTDFDLAIRATNTPPDNLIAKYLTEYEHWVCASPSYIAAMGPITSPTDLLQHECLSAPEGRRWEFQQAQDSEVIAIETQGSFAMNDYAPLVEACIHGDGILRAPEHLLLPHVSTGQLQRLLMDYHITPRKVWLVYPQRINGSARLAAFNRFVLDWF